MPNPLDSHFPSSQPESSAPAVFVEALYFGAVERPTNALAQSAAGIANTALGTDFQVKPVELKQSKQHETAQTVGAAVGSFIPFMVAGKISGRLFGRALTEAGTGALADSTLSRSLTVAKKQGTTGLVYGAMFEPASSTSRNDFLTDKGKSMLANTATFGSLGGFSTAFKGIGSEIVAGMAAGIPAGYVDANVRSLLTKHKLADRETVNSNMLSMATLGGLFGIAGDASVLRNAAPAKLEAVKAALRNAAPAKLDAVKDSLSPVPATGWKDAAQVMARSVGETEFAGPEWIPRRMRQRLDGVEMLHRIDTPHLPNFAAMSDRFWRSGQFDAVGLQQLKDLGAKTIVNLQSDPHPMEPEMVMRMGLRYIEMPLEEKRPMQAGEVDTLLKDASDPNNYPMVFHCYYGQDRTGGTMTILQNRIEGRPPLAAWNEMMAFGVREKHRDFRESIAQFLSDKPPAVVPSASPPGSGKQKAVSL